VTTVFGAAGALGHEQVVFCIDSAAGYRSIIAIHSTVLGPAVGGTRLWRYDTESDALDDALRLSRGMTYKNALAGLPFGGGKAVILRPADGFDRSALFGAHGRFIERLGGNFISGEDVGVTVADIEIVREATTHVAGIAHRAGDPSPFTARGVHAAMRACAQHRWGAPDLAGRTVALQGCGAVARELARLLDADGARLIVCDVDAGKAERLVAESRATLVEPDAIYDADTDIFAPCALGGVLNDATLPRLRAGIVAGAANNQLLDPRHGRDIEARGITYAPDYVANAGGVIAGSTIDLLSGTMALALERVDAIFETVKRIFELAREMSVPASDAADVLAERIVAGESRSAALAT
jgi:leucine dehydrogenase